MIIDHSTDPLVNVLEEGGVLKLPQDFLNNSIASEINFHSMAKISNRGRSSDGRALA